MAVVGGLSPQQSSRLKQVEEKTMRNLLFTWLTPISHGRLGANFCYSSGTRSITGQQLVEWRRTPGWSPKSSTVACRER